jgi:kynurenine formamidase
MSFKSPFQQDFDARAQAPSQPMPAGAFGLEQLRQLQGQKVYDLEQPRYAGMPGLAALTPPYTYLLHRRHADTANPAANGPRSGATGLLLSSDHLGTHIDALCHQADEFKLFGGEKLSPAIETPAGFTQHGAETIAPIVAQGFLLDVAYHHKASALPADYVITAEDLEATMKAQGRLMMGGGVILIRTGYGQYWNDAGTYSHAAGLSPAANRWLLARQPLAVGADNLTWDAPGARDETTGANLFGHLELLARHGIYIFENLNLEGLAADFVDHFLFIAAPLKLKGATGSPVRPLAVELQAQPMEFMGPER